MAPEMYPILGGQGRGNAMETKGCGVFRLSEGSILGVIFDTKREAKLIQGLGTAEMAISHGGGWVSYSI